MLVLREAVARGLLGDITDVEVRINLHTPWGYWAFLKGVPRLEVLMDRVCGFDCSRRS